MSRIDGQRPRIEALLTSVREDHRADHCFDTKRAAQALRITPNKFGDWKGRTWAKLTELAIYEPAALSAELFSIFAAADLERRERLHRQQLSRRTGE